MKLPKNYEPKEYESDIYALWEKSGAFTPKDSGETYSIVIPPPNANGDLHLGHALNLGLEDIAIRYHRMKGDKTLFLPGADHAGFETQVVYEKELARQGKSRFDFSRDELYQQIWDFVATNKGNYESQFRKIGASLDWSRYTFTLDDKIVRRSHQTFKKMWDEGLIYRGERLVNFCTFHGTSFADIEVDYEEEKGHLWHIKYPLTDGSGSLTVATTRPETMLGDTAVAVNPKDERYKQFLGKTIKLPLTAREIPVIADDMVDPEFGTGAVKITPAHDPNDYEVAKRHDLPFITVIDHEGKLTHDVPEPYPGLAVEEGREAVVKALDKADLLVKTEDHVHSVGHCYKCGTVLQPLLKEQWFVDMQPLTKPAIQALEKGKIKFYPESKKHQLILYLRNLRDWNISRQIAWGIPIPAFQNLDDPEDWIYDERVDQETLEIDGRTYRRDPDVFDTWFSSSSWPYATLDYPDNQDFKDFYPLSLMETGADILYPWVSRMIMLGLYVTGQVPFETVYLHGLIQDEHGAKMSKSKGNVIEPMSKIDRFGSDAFRLGIAMDEGAGQNRPYDETKIVGARNFCNKLWNVARFIEDKVGDSFKRTDNPEAQTAADDWILHRLGQTTEAMSGYLDSYRFSEAADLIYHFVWNDLADWYVEASKTHLNKDVLAYVLESTLKLAHPFAPFLTETIWQTLKWEEDGQIITSSWPKPPKADAGQAADFEEVKSIVSQIRFIKSTLHIRTGPNLYHAGDDFIGKHGQLIKSMARLTHIQEVSDGHGLHLTATNHPCWLDIDEESARQFRGELKKQVTETEKQVQKLEARLNNKSYTQNAPKEIVNQTKSQLKEAKKTLEKAKEEHSRFATE